LNVSRTSILVVKLKAGYRLTFFHIFLFNQFFYEL
jgi:hypothetical protein